MPARLRERAAFGKPRARAATSISEHFKNWDSLGLELGNMEEAKILVEVGGGSGSIDFAQATLAAQ